MHKPQHLRRLAWAHEFERADNEEGQHRHALERTHRSAMRRAAASGAMARGTEAHPSPRRPSAADLTPPAAWIPDLSLHGRARLQQRGITLDQVLTVMAFGAEQRSHGASRYFLDKKARACLAVEMPDVLRVVERLDIHIVVGDDDRLITAAHRTKRLRRDIQSRGRRSTTH
jgi:hypothetical protein